MNDALNDAKLKLFIYLFYFSINIYHYYFIALNNYIYITNHDNFSREKREN